MTLLGRRSGLALSAIILLFVLVLHGRWSPGSFGFFHDDSLYFSSARSLASGAGYTMPSVPGDPGQTKYPVLYPWLLSLIWRVWPTFPGNLYPAFWLSVLAGCAFVVGSFFLLRQLGTEEKPALALVCLAGFHPTVQILSGSLLSDMTFLALTVWSLVLAEAGLCGAGRERQVFWNQWVVASLLAALAVLARSIGVAVGLGIVAMALLRRRYRAAAVGLLPWLTCLGAGLWWSWRQQMTLGSSLEAEDGYSQTMLFYTSYLGFWKFSVPDVSTLQAMVSFNFAELLKQPAILSFLLPAQAFSPMLLQMLAIALSFVVVKGVVGQVRAYGWHPAHSALGFTIPFVLVWNYTLMDRFLLPFLAIFLAGAYREVRWVLRATREVIRSARPRTERLVSVIMALGVIALSVYTVSYLIWFGPAAAARGRQHRESLATRKQEAYRWIRSHTARTDRFIAYEDAVLFLYTGRQALRPIAFSTAAFYLQDKGILDQDLDRLADTARAVSARYWMVAPDDFSLDGGEEMILDYLTRLLASYPVAFSSGDGSVRIYDIADLHDRNVYERTRPPGGHASAAY